jgi:hypothetical protein
VTCIVCAKPLNRNETQTCRDCTDRTRAHLTDIAFAYAMLDDVIEGSSYRSLALPGGDALVMHSDGNAAGLKPYKPSTQQPRPGVDYPALLGRYVVHPAYVDDRPVADGKEHYADHWPSDPTSVLALLEVNERDWRDVFGHGPAANIALVSTCIDYLHRWLDLAARTHPGFDEFAADIRVLHHRLTHVAGAANDPIRAAAECFECGAKRLVRVFRGGTTEPWRDHVANAVKRHAGLPPAEFLAAVNRELRPRRGFEFEGAVDDYECAACGREYDQESYFLALRAAAIDSEGFVPIGEAARAARLPVGRVRNWYDRGQLRGYCDVNPRRHWVWWHDVYDRSAMAKQGALTG